MAYAIPGYIETANIDDPRLRFVWDDTRASEDFQFSPDALLEKIAGVTLHAKIALGIGIYEWVIWRFRSISDDPLPFQVAEAAWCANVHRLYMKYIELDRDCWLGPIRGPLWCATTWLLPMVFFSDDRPEEWESGLAYLSRLAVHVLPRPSVFKNWLRISQERLVKLYPLPQPDPFEDLFGEREEERRGPLVPREVLDPRLTFQTEVTNLLINKYLAGVDRRTNTLLRSPEEMVAAGFDGAPYTIQ